MSHSDYLSLQVSIICVLLFILGVATIIGRPEWFRLKGDCRDCSHSDKDSETASIEVGPDARRTADHAGLADGG